MIEISIASANFWIGLLAFVVGLGSTLALVVNRFTKLQTATEGLREDYHELQKALDKRSAALQAALDKRSAALQAALDRQADGVQSMALSVAGLATTVAGHDREIEILRQDGRRDGRQRD